LYSLRVVEKRLEKLEEVVATDPSGQDLSGRHRRMQKKREKIASETLDAES
jgi:hypothetical protein